MNWSHIDLFSGIGGFSLGFERADIKTIAFCESDERCQRVLEHRWPGVPRYPNVNHLRGLPLSGFITGREALWIEWAQEQGALQPDWLVVENTGHRWRAWVPELRRELWTLGYASVCLRVRASNVGAVHERARAFVIANADCEQLRKLSGWWQREGRKVADELAESWDSSPERLGTDDELPDWTHRRKQLGNAVVTKVAELIARGIRAASS
jgi:DNA (cytosine-5)-methyltransferase 1